MLTVEMSATIHRKPVSETKKQTNKKKNKKYKLPGSYARAAGLAVVVGTPVQEGVAGPHSPLPPVDTTLIPQNWTHSYHHRETLCQVSGGSHGLINLKAEIKSGQRFKIMSVGGSAARPSGCFRLL